MLTSLVLAGCASNVDSMTRSITSAPFGTTSAGEVVELFTMTNPQGIEVRAITYGGIIVSLKTPDRDGRWDDIVLGFDSLEPYDAGSPYFGSIIGRYGNRIARGRFSLDGQTFTLATNNEPNHLARGRAGLRQGRLDGGSVRATTTRWAWYSPTPAPTAKRAIPGRWTCA